MSMVSSVYGNIYKVKKKIRPKKRKGRKKNARAKLPYAEFLQTQYWQDVRKIKLKQAQYQCQRCKAKNVTLNVHHKTYRHRGHEKDHLKDLIVLCVPCHQREHGK